MEEPAAREAVSEQVGQVQEVVRMATREEQVEHLQVNVPAVAAAAAVVAAKMMTTVATEVLAGGGPAQILR